jgi:hypothetical protein
MEASKMSLFNKMTSGYMAGVVFCIFTTLAENNLQASEFTPANFKSESFAGIEIDSNDIHDDPADVFIHCQTIIEVNGVPSNYSCTTSFIKDHRIFLRAVLNAIPRQSFIPATVNNEAVRVQMNFTVIFRCEEKICTNAMVRNHLYSYKEYGLNYVAPQPVVKDDAWYEGFKTKLSWANNLIYKINDDVALADENAGWTFLYSPFLPAYTLSAEINTEGAAYDQLVNNTAQLKKYRLSRSIKQEAERAVASIGDVNFIPGFYNDEPVTMRLYEWGMMKLSGSDVIKPDFFFPYSWQPYREPSQHEKYMGEMQFMRDQQTQHAITAPH